MKLKKVAPGSTLKDRLTTLCQAELGEAWEPVYFMRNPRGSYKCFCKDPSYRCYVSVMVVA